MVYICIIHATNFFVKIKEKSQTMNRLILSLIFLIAMHTTCFSSIIDGIELEELNSKKAAISEQYKECERRKGLQEYSSDPLFQQETEKLRTEADNGMADLAKAGYVEARIWRGKRELQLLEFHRDRILSSLEEEEENLKAKTHGIHLKEASRLRRDLQDIYEHLNDCEHSLNILKELIRKKVKVVHDTQYYQENNICLFSLYDEDEALPKPASTPQIAPTSAPITYDHPTTYGHPAIFRSVTKKTIDELTELKGNLLASVSAKPTEALDFIKRIHDHVNQNGYLDSTNDQSNGFVDFIFSIIQESTDYSYATKPSFRAVSRVRDTLLSALICLSDDNVTSAEILMALTNCLLSPSNKHNINDTIDCVKAELQIVGEIRRYLTALNDPNDYAKLIYKKLYESKNEGKIRKYYMNDTDYDSCVYVGSLFEPANNRFFTLQTFFINASYNPYKGVIGSAMIDFMGFGRKHFRIKLADINKYIKNKDKNDCPYYVYEQTDHEKPVQTILISKNGPYSIRYHHEKRKLTIGLLHVHPYDKQRNRWIPNSSGLLVCDGENEIIKYARYDVFDFVTPANRLHQGGFLNATSYNNEEELLSYAHFQLS